MTTYARIALAVFAVTLLLPTAARAQRQTETVDRTVAMPSGGTLRLNNFTGDVRITGGTGRDVVIKAWRTARPEVLQRVRLRIETVGSTVEIEANERDGNDDRGRRWRDGDRDDNNNVVETRFEIQVPAGARLNVNTFSSDVIITGVEGRHDVQTFSGEIDIDATRQGVNPEVDVETFSGDIRVKVASNARGDVTLETFSGNLDATFPLTLRSSNRRSIRAELPGGTGRSLRFKSFSGNLRVLQ